jgi:hypothetical protein
MQKRILESSSLVHISHQPSSTDQASTDFSVKTTFKGGIFKDVEAIKKHATAILNAVL